LGSSGGDVPKELASALAVVLDVAETFKAFTSKTDLLDAVVVEEVTPEGFDLEQ